MTEDLIELIADFIHDQWSHWMKYLYSILEDDWDPTTHTKDVTYVLPVESYDRWLRQMNTPYSELSEKEKDSDREWAIKLLELIKNDLNYIRDEKISEFMRKEDE